MSMLVPCYFHGKSMFPSSLFLSALLSSLLYVRSYIISRYTELFEVYRQYTLSEDSFTRKEYCGMVRLFYILFSFLSFIHLFSLFLISFVFILISFIRPQLMSMVPKWHRLFLVITGVRRSGRRTMNHSRSWVLCSPTYGNLLREGEMRGDAREMCRDRRRCRRY